MTRRVEPVLYYQLYTLDGDVKEDISATNPSNVKEVIVMRERDTLFVELCEYKPIEETSTMIVKNIYSLSDLDKMNENYFKDLFKGRLTYQELEEFKSWF